MGPWSGESNAVIDKTYTQPCASVRNAYPFGGELVMQPGCSLPNVCVACGRPAWGNLEKKEFPGIEYDLSSLFAILYLIFGTNYIFQFPFCPNCEPDRFQLKPTRLDRHLAVFVGAAMRFLEALPAMPDEVASERNLTWFHRKFRWLVW